MKSQNERKFLIDMIIFAALVFTTISGFMLWLGEPQQMESFFQNTPFNPWTVAHLFWGGIVLSGIIIHVAQHWKWLKSMRGRSLPEMSKKLRANRIVDRVMWFTFIASSFFGVCSMLFQLFGKVDLSLAVNRLHVAFGLTWLTLAIVHLVFHRKWIAFTLQGLIVSRKPIL